MKYPIPPIINAGQFITNPNTIIHKLGMIECEIKLRWLWSFAYFEKNMSQSFRNDKNAINKKSNHVKRKKECAIEAIIVPIAK